MRPRAGGESADLRDLQGELALIRERGDPYAREEYAAGGFRDPREVVQSHLNSM
jgi:hypothetical protein